MESVPISQGRAESKFQEVERSAYLTHLLWWDMGCAWRKALQILSCLVLSVGTFTPTQPLSLCPYLRYESHYAQPLARKKGAKLTDAEEVKNL